MRAQVYTRAKAHRHPRESAQSREGESAAASGSQSWRCCCAAYCCAFFFATSRFFLFFCLLASPEGQRGYDTLLPMLTPTSTPTLRIVAQFLGGAWLRFAATDSDQTNVCVCVCVWGDCVWGALWIGAQLQRCLRMTIYTHTQRLI